MVGTNEATYRSRLNALPMSLKEKLGEIPLQKGMRPTSRKEMALDALDKSKIAFTEIGTGTNRFIIKYDGFAIKIALDHEGIADNKQEYVMSDLLAPHVAYCHEISRGGHLAVADYCPAFTSPSEMWLHSTEMKEILADWSKRFLLGDVGVTDINYANWGLAPGGKAVCIDYAYIFPADLDLFKCNCGSKRMTVTSDFSKYKCCACGHVYEDREIRVKISNEMRLRLFENTDGILMTEEFEKHEIDPKYVQYSTDPDSPDPYEVAINTYRYLNNQDSLYWRRKGR